MIEINNLTKTGVVKKEIESFVKKIFKKLRIKKNLSLAFVSVKRIKKLNKTYLKRNRTTDVLSFSGQGDNLGEIVICLSQAKKQAKQQPHSLKEEIKILVSHGLLHLLGFDHQKKKEKQKMETLEKKLLKL